MSSDLVCWKCGAGLDGVPMPLSRYERCRRCGADLYVCRLCQFHEPRWSQGCREERAESVRARDSANFCDYFRPRPNAYQPAADTAAAARAQLEALFGGAPAQPAPPADTARAELEKLFGKKS